VDETGEVPDDGKDADEQSPGKTKKKRSFWVELPILVVVAVVLAVLLQLFVARVYLIPSASMEHTLHGCPGCTGDRILVDEVTYDFTDPSPGDVIVFHRPDHWSNSEYKPPASSNFLVEGLRKVGSLVGLVSPSDDDFVKRVIATGGQTIQCCDAQNRVLVNGKPLDESYISWREDMPPVQQPFAPITVPAGYLWVMGDNRNDSCDSRCQGGGGANGLVPVDKVVGKARLIVLPPSRWGTVTDHDPQTP
jgi:signal peptidase I